MCCLDSLTTQRVCRSKKVTPNCLIFNVDSRYLAGFTRTDKHSDSYCDISCKGKCVAEQEKRHVQNVLIQHASND